MIVLFMHKKRNTFLTLKNRLLKVFLGSIFSLQLPLSLSFYLILCVSLFLPLSSLIFVLLASQGCAVPTQLENFLSYKALASLLSWEIETARVTCTVQISHSLINSTMPNKWASLGFLGQLCILLSSSLVA